MDSINLEARVGPLAQKVLHKRGFRDPESIRAFLCPAFYKPIDPLELPGMQETVELLLKAIKAGEEICVYGDYDADGVTSTALLVSLLRKLQARVCYHVPDRFSEGYGMNEQVIRNLQAKGVSLILTCDCGISNLTEVNLAKQLGLTVLITDHHQLPPELPRADAIVNPQMLPEGHQARFLPGAGVAWMLAQAVLTKVGQNPEHYFLELATLGIIADVVPLLGENRYLVQVGLNRLRVTSRPGLLALAQVANLNLLEITEEQIGFQLIPRLNAAGRLASAALAVELLLCEDLQKSAELAGKLDEINRHRRALGEEMLQEALALLGKPLPTSPIVLYQAHWHHGIIGIIAGRLAELYQVPVLLMSLKEDNKTITGSARSIPGVHIFQALQQCSGLLGKFGGHAGAAGFSLSLDQLELFKKAITRQLEQALVTLDSTASQVHDLEIGLEELNIDLHHELLALAPFGEGNPIPSLFTKSMEVRSQRPFSEEKHLRLVLGQGQASFPALWWWGGSKQLSRGVSAVYTLNLNKCQGKENLQLTILELRDELDQAEKAKEAKVAPLALIDLRQQQNQALDLPVFKDPQFFAEAFARELNLPAKDRYGIVSSENLVLMEIPPGLRVLQEILAVSRAENLVLAYSTREQASDKQFLQQFAGMLKFIIAKQNGDTNLPTLAVGTGQTEITVAAALKFLQAKGMVQCEFYSSEGVHLSQGNGKTQKGYIEAEARLKVLLAETRAFRRFLTQADPEKIYSVISTGVNPYQITKNNLKDEGGSNEY